MKRELTCQKAAGIKKLIIRAGIISLVSFYVNKNVLPCYLIMISEIVISVVGLVLTAVGIVISWLIYRKK